MALQAIRYSEGCLEILDQLRLPEESKYIPIKSVEDGWQAIHQMQVRGAPAIAIVSSLSVAVELYPQTFTEKAALKELLETKLRYLETARPTAVNMKQAADFLTSLATEWMENESVDVNEMKSRIIKSIEDMLAKDIADNEAIGEHGASDIIARCGGMPVKVLTHCNTGSLATAGYGTALGVIRSLHSKRMLEHVYCTETRPYNQGARLTAYELVHDKMPATLICDNNASALMKQVRISAVVVGADRVALNGDTANKIGTYQLAVAAKHHNALFYIAAPTSSIDLNLPSGEHIPIEERPEKEMTHVKGVRIAAPGIQCWNPAFDITPAELITGGIITELRVMKPEEIQKLAGV